VYLPACVATAVQKRICESSELKHRTLSKKTTGLSKTFATNFRRESVQRPSNSTVNNEQAVNRVKLRVYTSLQFLSVRFRLVLESPMSAHACVAETPTVGGSSVRSGCRQALTRTTSTHGTGPSRQRPTLANPEGGGLVRDGPAAKDAGPLPAGRECCAAALQAGHGYWQQRGGTDVGARAVLGQVTGADGSAAIRTGVQGGRVRSLGRCGVSTRAACLDADTALSHGLSPCELVALRRG
jgi:hypothetical protein